MGSDSQLRRIMLVEGQGQRVRVVIFDPECPRPETVWFETFASSTPYCGYFLVEDGRQKGRVHCLRHQGKWSFAPDGLAHDYRSYRTDDGSGSMGLEIRCSHAHATVRQEMIGEAPAEFSMPVVLIERPIP